MTMEDPSVRRRSSSPAKTWVARAEQIQGADLCTSVHEHQSTWMMSRACMYLVEKHGSRRVGGLFGIPVLWRYPPAGIHTRTRSGSSMAKVSVKISVRASVRDPRNMNRSSLEFQCVRLKTAAGSCMDLYCTYQGSYASRCTNDG